MSIVFLFFLLHASYLVYVGRSHMLHSCFNSTITQIHWRWWVLDGTLSMRIRSEQWKPTLSTNLRRLICTTSSWRCGMDSNYKSYIYNWSHKTLSDRPSLHSLITLDEGFQRGHYGWLYWPVTSTQPDKLGLQVIILGFIRPEQNFDSLEALVDAIRCAAALLKCPKNV